MSRIIKSILFSTTTAFVVFAVLAAVFGIGSYLAGVAEIKPIFNKMTSRHVWSCIDGIFANRSLLLWLFVLVSAAIVLLINTLCCTSRQLKQFFLSNTVKVKQFRLHSMAFIHVLALAVLIFHGLDITLVERHKPVEILQSESAVLGSYTVKVDSISYQTDRGFIRESDSGKRTPSFKIPRKQFSIDGNRAKVSLYQNGELVKEAEIGLFDPFRVGNTFFILDGFYIPYGSDDLGVTLLYSYNPLVVPFFALYAILFSALLFHCYRNRYRPAVDEKYIYRVD